MKRDFDPAQAEFMDQAELLDGRPSAELQRDLSNLRWLNRHFGAISILHRFLNRWLTPVILDPRQPRLRVLDLATGEGDLPRELVTWCRERNIPVTVDAVDANAATLAVALVRVCSGSPWFCERVGMKGGVMCTGVCCCGSQNTAAPPTAH